MKVVPPVIAEVKRIREIFSVHHGVPISQEFVDFANAIGNLCDAAIALAAAAVDVPAEAQGEPYLYAMEGPNGEWMDGEGCVFTDRQLAQDEVDDLNDRCAGHKVVPLFRRVEAWDQSRTLGSPIPKVTDSEMTVYAPDARPAIGPNTYRGEDGSVSVLGTSTGVDARPVTNEQKREMVGWVAKELGEVDSRDFSFERRAIAEEIVSKILDWPSTGKPTPSEEKR